MLCIMDGICYQSFTDSDVCTYMSDRLDINYRIIPHSSLLSSILHKRNFPTERYVEQVFRNALHKVFGQNMRRIKCIFIRFGLR